MGCASECCKKKKPKKSIVSIGRKDTKFVAESFKHVKIEIKNKNNDNSNSKEVPLINNFFKNTLNNPNALEQINSQNDDSKSKDSEGNKENNATKEIKESKDMKEKLQIKNLLDDNENKDKDNSQQILWEQSKSFNDKNSERTRKSKDNKNNDNSNMNNMNILPQTNKSESKHSQITESNISNHSNKSNRTKKSKISQMSNKTNKTSKSKKSNNSHQTNNKDLKKSKILNLKDSNELSNLMENNYENNSNHNDNNDILKDINNNQNSNKDNNKNNNNDISITKKETNKENGIKNLNSSINIFSSKNIKSTKFISKLNSNNEESNNNDSNNNASLKDSIIKRNKSRKYTKTDYKFLKSNKDFSQIFVDYKTFIKGKPYSELNKEYKQGIDIGEGGFGKVKTIIHKKTGQLRAMKLIKKSKEFNLDEIDNLMLLNHPNILKLFEYYYDEKENIYIITEYIRGEELFNKIQEKGKFSEEDTAVIIKSVLQAITYCHSCGIIHRDLKPENILIPAGKGKIDYTLLKIIDFGASVLKKDDGKISFRFGTPYYIAPEVLLESYNEKCDVWSIGVITYLLLLGQAPFDGDDDDIICQKIIQEEIDYQNSKIKSLSPEAVDFLKKLLEKDPEKRISSSQALEHAWIKKFAPHTRVNRAFSRKIYKNLSNFREESQLSTAVVTFITNYLMNDDELKLLKKLFFELDVKGVGVITKEELFKGMEDCFEGKVTHEEVDKIFGNIDYDNNGTISFDEFVKAAIDKKKLLTEEKLKAAFALFDRNGDGDIEAKELKEVIGDDNNNEDNIWDQMIKEVDLDGNGVIDFDEFKEMMKKLCS